MGKIVIKSDTGNELTINNNNLIDGATKEINFEDFKYIRNTVAEMLDLNGKLVDGDVVFLKGYHTANDGGSGTFVYSATGDKSTHNGGTVIDPLKAFPSDWDNEDLKADWFNGNNSGTGVLERVYSGAVNVKWFGAKGDGVTDDTKAVQQCMDNCDNIVIPMGTFVLSNVLNVKSSTVIKGVSLTNTILQSKYGVFTTYFDGVRHDNILIENLTLNGVDKSNNSIGIYIESSFSTINKIVSKNFYYGIRYNQGWTNNIYNCHITNCYNGMELWEATNNVTVTGCEINHNDAYGIRMQGCRNNRIINCGIEENGYAGIWVHGGTQATRELIIADNYFENNCNDSSAPELADIYVDRDGQEISMINISGNYFDGAYATKGIWLDDCETGLVQNNNKVVTLGWGSHNVVIINNEVDYSGTTTDHYCNIINNDVNNGLMIDGKLTRFTVKRNGNELFSAGSDGNTDTLRLMANNLPTSDPQVAGQLWNNNGTVTVSAG